MSKCVKENYRDDEKGNRWYIGDLVSYKTENKFFSRRLGVVKAFKKSRGKNLWLLEVLWSGGLDRVTLEFPWCIKKEKSIRG
jgi:hypothetical protein